MTTDYDGVYGRAYQHRTYRMGDRRYVLFEKYWCQLIREDQSIISFCDVATGRGETIDYVSKFPHVTACGYELPSVAHLHKDVTAIDDISNTPAYDEEFDVVACLDVMEHLEEDDVEPALAELARITGKYLMLSIAWFPSKGFGEVFHLTLKPSAWWDERIKALGMREHSKMIDEKGKIGWWILAKS